MSFLQDCFDPSIGFPLDTPQLAGGRKAGSPIGEFPVAEGKKPWYSQGMSALGRSMHAVYDLKYHFVWIPKYRKKIRNRSRECQKMPAIGPGLGD
jgi:hypothetical protein